MKPIVKSEFVKVHHAMIDVKRDDEVRGDYRRRKAVGDSRQALDYVGKREDRNCRVMNRVNCVVTPFYAKGVEELVGRTKSGKCTDNEQDVHKSSVTFAV